MTVTFADSVFSKMQPCGDPQHGERCACRVDEMHRAIDVLEDAVGVDPLNAYVVATEALMQALRVVETSGDPRGPIGEVAARLLKVHAHRAASAGIDPDDLVEWLIVIQFHNRHPLRHVEPADYLTALGQQAVQRYAARLDDIAVKLAARPGDSWATLTDRQILETQRQRLAVLTGVRDPLTGVRDPLAGVGHPDVAAPASDAEGDEDHHPVLSRLDESRYAYDAARRWWLLACESHPEEIAAARLAMFRIRPTYDNAVALREAATDPEWETCRFEVLAALETRPRQAVGFVLEVLDDAVWAWDLAHLLALDPDDELWDRMVEPGRREAS